MSEDLRTRIRDAAPEPTIDLDERRLVDRALRHRRFLRIGTAAAVAVGLVVVAVFAGQLLVDRDRDVRIVGPGEDATGDPTVTTLPAVPDTGELWERYAGLFEGMPRPDGSGVLVAVDGRVEGLGALLQPGTVIRLDQPDAVQDAPTAATFEVTVTDHDTGETVATVTPDTPPGASFEGPRASDDVGTRYVLAGTLTLPDGSTQTWTDAAVVVEPDVDIDLYLTSRPEAGHTVRIVLVNTGTVAVIHGTGYRLERRTPEGWEWINRDQGFKAIGLPLPPAQVSDPLVVDLPATPGPYRITADFSIDDPRVDGPPRTSQAALTFELEDDAPQQISTPVLAVDGPEGGGWAVLVSRGEGDRWCIDSIFRRERAGSGDGTCNEVVIVNEHLEKLGVATSSAITLLYGQTTTADRVVAIAQDGTRADVPVATHPDVPFRIWGYAWQDEPPAEIVALDQDGNVLESLTVGPDAH